ncbi:carbon monoxide dehydrogenase [Acidovorax sp. 1608163]|uniref:CoxG family protein n=1 Tax=Acidovorax sp. 1608163 TaxID=2478662 RepID=UPI000EF6AD8B|nr:carbon monoxide dehydrogenase subunit G [Acidovorax sp. 1608163]AYM96840.1 carbon monoxide dehydrogenase [Acidovorax sp. 1608163]
MEMQASRTLAVSQQQAWDALNDPEVLKLCIPGCDKVEASGENQYAVAMALKIGPVSAKFAGKITLADIVPPESYTIAFDGSGGVAGFGKGQAQVKLVPLPADAAGQSSCELHYTVHATVGGKIAQLGQRLIDGAAKTMAEDFFKRFDNEMQRRYPRDAADTQIQDTLLQDTVMLETPTQPDALQALPTAAAAKTPSVFPPWVWVAIGAGGMAALFWLAK